MPRHLIVNGQEVRRLRTDAKLTQEVAAVRLGIAASSLRRIETGRESVHLSTLGKLADLYKVEPHALTKWVH
jgi:transcriptional regulator with XRE-family HTH domain